MVYDCFPFFNELDLLELRLSELDSVVDKFVLVEASRNFQKEEKPLYYKENIDRFKKYNHKIIHIVVDKFPGFFHKFRIPKPWDYSNFQKNQVSQALKGCKPSDVIIISDLDEIPKAKKIIEYKSKKGIKVFDQLLCYYYMNCVCVESPNEMNLVKYSEKVYWRGTVMLNYADFTNFKKVRSHRDFPEGKIIVKDGGWHFSYLGGAEKILLKVKSLEHASEKHYQIEDMTKENISTLLNEGKDLYGRPYKYKFIDETSILPTSVLNNIERWSSFIKKI